MTFSKADYEFMSRAIKLAAKGCFTTTPNPNVGCVIVKDNAILGEGWHQKAGFGHAEVNALEGLSSEYTEGSTAYVTLEPCSHFGRTPPCAKKLIDAKVTKVVIAMLDPNPKVSGNGVRMLQEAGIEVTHGILEADARALNLGFLTRMEQKRPFIQVKLAASLDGKTALNNGDSKWITSSQARRDVQIHRAKSCAIVSSAQTVIADNAKLNVRQSDLPLEYPKTDTIKSVRQPVKIILDGRGQITAQNVESLDLFHDSTQVILVRKESTTSFEPFSHISVVTMPYSSHDGFDLEALNEWCYQQEFGVVWVEAGAQLAASFVNSGLYDELIVYLAPKLMGQDSRDMLPIGPFSKMSEVQNLQLKSLVSIGDDLKLTYEQAV